MQWHPNGMRRHEHTHKHKRARSRQQGGMFQLADADRCSAAFVCLGEKVECIALCRPPRFSSLSLSFLLSAELKNTGHLRKRGGGGAVREREGPLHIAESLSGELFGLVMPFEQHKSHLRLVMCLSFVYLTCVSLLCKFKIGQRGGNSIHPHLFSLRPH